MGEKELLVAEVKGLLVELEAINGKTRFELACDNLTDIVAKTAAMKQILDRIDDKVKPLIEKERSEVADIW